MAVMLAACGFTPIYERQSGTPSLRALTIDGPAAPALQQALAGRYQITPEALYAARIDSKINKRNLQIDGDGLAARIELTLSVKVQLIDGKAGETRSVSASGSQTVARQDSGADQLRDETVAMELLAAQLADDVLVQIMQHIKGAAR